MIIKSTVLVSVMMIAEGCVLSHNEDPFTRDSLPAHWAVELRDKGSGVIIPSKDWLKEEKDYLTTPSYQELLNTAEPGACKMFKKDDGILLLWLTAFDWSRDTVVVNREWIRKPLKAEQPPAGDVLKAVPEE